MGRYTATCPAQPGALRPLQSSRVTKPRRFAPGSLTSTTWSASPFWAQRALIPRAGAGRAPLFLTQGYLEDNTRPDGAFDFFNAVPGTKRAWFGQFDHIRPSDLDPDDGKTPLMARDPQIFWDELVRFLDHHVKGVPAADAPTDRDAPVVVGSGAGTWRGEPAWPPADAQANLEYVEEAESRTH